MKKRLMSFVWVFAAVIAGLFILEAEPVYAATKISSAKDLLAMEENPSGDYYLAKDITVPANTCLFADGIPFTGTLDGKGHKLKGYKSTEASAIFDSARFAEFKNLSLTNVDIKVQGSAAALVCNADGCLFKNIKVSGTIVSSGDSGSVGGIVARGSGSMEKCKNSAKITAQIATKTLNLSKAVGGLAGDFTAAVLENCSNSGTVTLSTGTDKYVLTKYYEDNGYEGHETLDFTFSAAGLVAGPVDYVMSCKNSGNVTINLKYSVDEKNSSDQGLVFSNTNVCVSGICNGIIQSITSSGNTGKIKVISDKSTKVYNGESYVAGLAGLGHFVGYIDDRDYVMASKCYNKGEVSVSGAAVFLDDESPTFLVGGLFGSGGDVSQSYNKGKVSVVWFSGNDGSCDVGGIAGHLVKINNSYNTGNVTVTADLSSSFYIGGLAGFIRAFDDKDHSTCNYSTGTVKGPKGWTYKDGIGKIYRGNSYGLLFGYWQKRDDLTRHRWIYNNYYTRSGKAYAGGDTDRKVIKAKATKVSSITAKKCPKLSSKYWKYSSKRKRMILKNNPEK